MSDRQTDKPSDRPTPQQHAAAERIGVVLESEETRRSRAMADAHAEAVKLHMDETVPGGRYVVNGVEVDANGKPIADKKPD